MKTKLLIIIVVGLIGCSSNNSPLTISPHSTVTKQASFDKNAQNSGVISADEHGFVVTTHFLDRHGIKYGFLASNSDVLPLPNGNYRITAEVMARCVEIDRARKNKQQ